MKYYSLVDLLASQWRNAPEPARELEHRVFRVPTDTTTFANYYYETQSFLKTVSRMDPLLEG